MNSPIIGYVTLYHLFGYFFIFGFLGWVAEVIFATLKTGKFVNRGFLNGPFCPIYGVGIAVAVLLINPFFDRWWLLLLTGGVLATVLEFFTGFILDKAFHTKWWDYSNEPFNIKGYVCLKFSLIWAIGVLLIANTLVPIVNGIIESLPFYWWGAGFIAFFWAVFTVDFVCVLKQLSVLKRDLKELRRIGEIIHKNSDMIGGKISDVTSKIQGQVKEIKEKIKKTRLGKAFPSLHSKDDKNNNKKRKN